VLPILAPNDLTESNCPLDELELASLPQEKSYWDEHKWYWIGRKYLWDACTILGGAPTDLFEVSLFGAFDGNKFSNSCMTNQERVRLNPQVKFYVEATLPLIAPLRRD
jgi:hypothetical protein